MATITLPKNRDAPLPPAVTAAIEAELQRRGVLPKPKQAWDAKDNPAGWNDISSLRGGGRELWHSKDFMVCLAGPSETGKTYSALKKVNALLWKYPGAQWVMLRKTYSSAIATCLQTYKRIIGENSPIKAYGGEKPEWFDYPNGSRLWVGGLDNLAKVLSGERDGYYINQAEELDLSEIETITTRATGRGSVMPYTQIIADANPGPPSHWIVTRDNITLLKSYHEDNPTLFEFAPEGIEKSKVWPDVAYNGRIGRWTAQGKRTLGILQNLTGMRRARLYLGQWVQAEGVVYETFDRNVHTVPSFEIPKEWRRIRVIDFGYENPFVCGWFAIDPDGRMYLYREIYLTHVLVSEIARDIRKLSAGETIEATICDHDAEDRATLAAEGIRSIPAYKKVSPGIQKVQDYLKVAGDGRPRLMILRDAQDQAPLTFPLQQPDAELLEKKKPTGTAQEFEFYIWEKDVSGKPNKEVPMKEFDHGMDMCFVAGTMVETDQGEIHIEQIREGDYVLTRKGYRKVIHSACTVASAQVVTVTLSNGRTLTGTRNHPVYVPGEGWITLDTLRCNQVLYDILRCKEELSWQSSLSGMGCVSTDTPKARIGRTHITLSPVERLVLAVSGCFTRRFGRRLTGQSQTGIRYTTRTKTLAITILATLSACWYSIISRVTGQRRNGKRQENTPTQYGILQKSGMVLPKAGNGIGNTPLSLNSENGNLASTYANIVQKNTSPPIMAETDFVPIVANRLRGASWDWIMSRAFANNASSRFNVTDTPKQRCALYDAAALQHASANSVIANTADKSSRSGLASRSGFADVRVLTKRELPTRFPVYNLTVEGEPEYFANGVLVHNCRYACAYVSGLSKRKGRAY